MVPNLGAVLIGLNFTGAESGAAESWMPTAEGNNVHLL